MNAIFFVGLASTWSSLTALVNLTTQLVEACTVNVNCWWTLKNCQKTPQKSGIWMPFNIIWIFRIWFMIANELNGPALNGPALNLFRRLLKTLSIHVANRRHREETQESFHVSVLTWAWPGILESKKLCYFRERNVIAWKNHWLMLAECQPHLT